MLRLWLRQSERKKYDHRYFKEEYWKEDLPGLTGNRGLSYNDQNHYERFIILANLLQKHFKFESFLDAGCGTGLLIEFLAQRGVRSYGFDVSKAAFHSANKVLHSRVVNAGTEAIPFSDACVDLVFCSDVLEHLPVFDVEFAVTELTRIAKRFIVSTINLDNPYHFHPTILSRKSWEALFLLTGVVKHAPVEENRIQRECKEKHPEYEFFVFEKLLSE